MIGEADQAARVAEFIGRTAEAWRRRALAAEQKLAVADRDRVGAIARLTELTEILQPEVDRNEAGHCDCCYRARRVLSVRQAEVLTLYAGEADSGRTEGEALRTAIPARGRSGAGRTSPRRRPSQGR